MNPTFFSLRLTLLLEQAAELRELASSRLSRLAREALAHRQGELCAEIEHLRHLADSTLVLAADNAGREVAA